jgi:hypothetical protein
MSAAAVIVMRRKQLVRRFREVGATDRLHAVTLQQLGQRRSWIFDQMERHSVFIEDQAGCYFMDERAAEAFLATRRKRALVITGALILILLTVWILKQMTG